jgi:hypothetical protein
MNPRKASDVQITDRRTEEHKRRAEAARAAARRLAKRRALESLGVAPSSSAGLAGRLEYALKAREGRR